MEVKIVSSVRYGKYKQFLEYANSLEHIIKAHNKKIRKHINLPSSLKVVLRPMKGLLGRALKYSDETYSIEIDTRQTFSDFRDTILHELIHIEQYFEKRFGVWEQNYTIWEGKKVMTNFSIYETERYNNLPWEKEAIERAAELNNIIFN